MRNNISTDIEHNDQPNSIMTFDSSKKTFLVTDASPFGIAAIIYQEELTGAWVPIDNGCLLIVPTEASPHVNKITIKSKRNH